MLLEKENFWNSWIQNKWSQKQIDKTVDRNDFGENLDPTIDRLYVLEEFNSKVSR